MTPLTCATPHPALTDHARLTLTCGKRPGHHGRHRARTLTGIALRWKAGA